MENIDKVRRFTEPRRIHQLGTSSPHFYHGLRCESFSISAEMQTSNYVVASKPGSFSIRTAADVLMWSSGASSLASTTCRENTERVWHPASLICFMLYKLDYAGAAWLSRGALWGLQISARFLRH